jgi:hypothetical protein
MYIANPAIANVDYSAHEAFIHGGGRYGLNASLGVGAVDTRGVINPQKRRKPQMAERAGAVKSIMTRPAVRVFDPILRCLMLYGRRRTDNGHPELHSTRP